MNIFYKKNRFKKMCKFKNNNNKVKMKNNNNKINNFKKIKIFNKKIQKSCQYKKKKKHILNQ